MQSIPYPPPQSERGRGKHALRANKQGRTQGVLIQQSSINLKRYQLEAFQFFGLSPSDTAMRGINPESNFTTHSEGGAKEVSIAISGVMGGS